MDTWQRRTAYYTVGLLGVVAVYAVAYRYGMRTLEGESITLLESLQVAVEAVTTTGFGSHAPWQSPVMNAFVIGMNATGVIAIFLALPVLVFPALETALSTTVPTAVEADRSDHVVVCSSYSPRVAALVSELRDRRIGTGGSSSSRATVGPRGSCTRPASRSSTPTRPSSRGSRVPVSRGRGRWCRTSPTGRTPGSFSPPASWPRASA